MHYWTFICVILEVTKALKDLIKMSKTDQILKNFFCLSYNNVKPNKNSRRNKIRRA